MRASTRTARAMLLLGSSLLVVLALAAGCGLGARAASADRRARTTPSARVEPGTRPSAAAATARPPTAAVIAAEPGTRHLEYVLVDGSLYVYDSDHGQRLLGVHPLPGIAGIRGAGADLATHMLLVSYGDDEGPGHSGALAAYDLLTGTVAWTVHYESGIDSFAVSRDGRRIYMPDGELSPDGVWAVLDARTGKRIASISAGAGPHNTVAGLGGRNVYLGPRNDRYLFVASTATDRIVRRIGPLYSGVRPFTVNGRETLAFTTATGLLGFQVSSIRTGHVLYTEGFGRRFTWDPATFAPSAPSHGISLSPDERRLWVVDAPNSYVHVFDVSGLPRHRPRMAASIALPHPFIGEQSDCSYDCARDGWLQNSLDGCLVYVGDSGDVLSAITLRPVGYIPELRQTRVFLEIDWRGGVPVATSTRSGLGYVTAASPPPPTRCRRK
jgi:DNA-binding beta-propeller fold protein YncE